MAVAAFVGQESSHRHLHLQYNLVLYGQGYINVPEPWIRWRIRLSYYLSARSSLAVVIAYEHFTAIMGDGLLRYARWPEGMQEPLKTLWAWHTAEGSEHKAVAFDVYRRVGGGIGGESCSLAM